MHGLFKTSMPYLLLLFAAPIASSYLARNSLASDLGLSESECRSCHGPGTSSMADRHHLLVLAKGLECLLCHQFIVDPTTFMNEVVATRDCLVCHTGSLADRHHLLVNRKTVDCFTCHAMTWDPVQLSYVVGFRFSVLGMGNIIGVVRDNGLRPVAGASIATNTGGYRALTAQDGSYRLDPVVAATYLLSASKSGYTEQTVRTRVIAGERTTIDFQLAATGVTPTPKEICFDGDDNDDDGLVDCADPNCSTDTICNITSLVEICNNKMDDDLDGFVDCKDTDCVNDASCKTTPLHEYCGNGMDDDRDGLVDCADATDCFGHLFCRERARHDGHDSDERVTRRNEASGSRWRRNDSD